MRDISFIIPLDPLSLFDVLMNFMGLRVAACQGLPDLTVIILYSTISSKPQSAKQALVPRSLADLCKASTFFVSLRVSTCWMWKKKTLEESIDKASLMLTVELKKDELSFFQVSLIQIKPVKEY